MTNTNTAALLDNINAASKQIVAMLAFGPVNMDRALYCTAGRFTAHEIKTALKMLHVAGICDYFQGQYVTAKTDSLAA
jgi:hypothetical protein